MLDELYSPGAASQAVRDFIVDFDPHAAFFRENYFNIIAEVAASYPVFRSTTHNNGFSVVSKQALIREVTTRSDIFPNTSQARVVPAIPLPPLIPVDANGDEHRFFRRVLNPMFTQNRMMERVAEVKSLARNLIAQARDSGHFDVVRDLAVPLTGITTMKLIGLEPDSWHDFDRPIHNSAYFIGEPAQRAADYLVYESRVRAEVMARLHMTNSPGLIGELACVHQDERPITEIEVEQIVNVLIIGGLGTTQAAVSSAAVYLGRHPDRRQELIDHPERLPNAINELIRVFSPVPFTGRYTAENIEVGGHAFRKGETALMFWSAANFDPDFIERPFEIDFKRKHNRSSSFAIGPHMCLGMHLAKIEMQACIEALLAIAPHYRLKEDALVMPEDIASSLAFLSVPVDLRRH